MLTTYLKFIEQYYSKYLSLNKTKYDTEINKIQTIYRVNYLFIEHLLTKYNSFAKVLLYQQSVKLKDIQSLTTNKINFIIYYIIK